MIYSPIRLPVCQSSLRGGGYKAKRSIINRIVRRTAIDGVVKSGTVQASFVRVVALCRLAKCAPISPHLLKIGRIGRVGTDSACIPVSDCTAKKEESIDIKIERLGLLNNVLGPAWQYGHY
tara:strand:+ start:366 stop:728 length:363 start_codon:yes stop_codon:yes gene_type:complete